MSKRKRVEETDIEELFKLQARINSCFKQKYAAEKDSEKQKELVALNHQCLFGSFLTHIRKSIRQYVNPLKKSPYNYREALVKFTEDVLFENLPPSSSSSSSSSTTELLPPPLLFIDPWGVGESVSDIKEDKTSKLPLLIHPIPHVPMVEGVNEDDTKHVDTLIPITDGDRQRANMNSAIGTLLLDCLRSRPIVDLVFEYVNVNLAEFCTQSRKPTCQLDEHPQEGYKSDDEKPTSSIDIVVDDDDDGDVKILTPPPIEVNNSDSEEEEEEKKELVSDEYEEKYLDEVHDHAQKTEDPTLTEAVTDALWSSIKKTGMIHEKDFIEDEMKVYTIDEMTPEDIREPIKMLIKNNLLIFNKKLGYLYLPSLTNRNETLIDEYSKPLIGDDDKVKPRPKKIEEPPLESKESKDEELTQDEVVEDDEITSSQEAKQLEDKKDLERLIAEWEACLDEFKMEKNPYYKMMTAEARIRKTKREKIENGKSVFFEWEGCINAIAQEIMHELSREGPVEQEALISYIWKYIKENEPETSLTRKSIGEILDYLVEEARFFVRVNHVGHPSVTRIHFPTFVGSGKEYKPPSERKKSEDQKKSIQEKLDKDGKEEKKKPVKGKKRKAEEKKPRPTKKSKTANLKQLTAAFVVPGFVYKKTVDELHNVASHFLNTQTLELPQKDILSDQVDNVVDLLEGCDGFDPLEVNCSEIFETLNRKFKEIKVKGKTRYVAIPFPPRDPPGRRYTLRDVINKEGCKDYAKAKKAFWYLVCLTTSFMLESKPADYSKENEDNIVDDLALATSQSLFNKAQPDVYSHERYPSDSEFAGKPIYQYELKPAKKSVIDKYIKKALRKKTKWTTPVVVSSSSSSSSSAPSLEPKDSKEEKVKTAKEIEDEERLEKVMEKALDTVDIAQRKKARVEVKEQKAKEKAAIKKKKQIEDDIAAQKAALAAATVVSKPTPTPTIDPNPSKNTHRAPAPPPEFSLGRIMGPSPLSAMTDDECNEKGLTFKAKGHAGLYLPPNEILASFSQDSDLSSPAIVYNEQDLKLQARTQLHHNYNIRGHGRCELPQDPSKPVSVDNIVRYDCHCTHLSRNDKSKCACLCVEAMNTVNDLLTYEYRWECVCGCIHNKYPTSPFVVETAVRVFGSVDDELKMMKTPEHPES